jgi:HEAT repeat protein
MPPATPSRVMGVQGRMSEQEIQALQNTIYLMNVLQTSGEPAQREWAAERLRVVDPQINSYVVEALKNTVRTDAAPLVRLAAIQSLAHMGANSPPVVAVIETATHDRDPRVRDGAQQALSVLAPNHMGETILTTAQTSKRAN